MSKEQLVKRLLQRIKDAETLNEEDRAHAEDLQKQLDAAKANSESLGRSYEEAKKEIAQLRKSISERLAQIDDYKLLVAILQADNTRLKQEVKSAKRQAMISTGLLILTNVLRAVF